MNVSCEMHCVHKNHENADTRNIILSLGLIFFNTWFTDFFSQNIKVGGGKKIKIKLLKKIFYFIRNIIGSEKKK